MLRKSKGFVRTRKVTEFFRNLSGTAGLLARLKSDFEASFLFYSKS